MVVSGASVAAEESSGAVEAGAGAISLSDTSLLSGSSFCGPEAPALRVPRPVGRIRGMAKDVRTPMGDFFD